MTDHPERHRKDDTMHTQTSGADAALLLTPQQAATLLSVGRSKIYELIATKEIRSVKVGGSRRLTRAAVLEFVAKLEGSAA